MSGRWLHAGAGIAAAAALAVSATPAFTAGEGTVNLSIQVASPCITVSPDNSTFAPRTFSVSAAAPTTSDAADRPRVVNCSEAAESLFVRATDATGSFGASWQLVDPAGIDVDKYALKVGAQAASRANQPWGFRLAAGDLADPPLVLYMPVAGSSGSGQTMSMSLTFTATF